jgi:rhomboid protease GluP
LKDSQGEANDTTTRQPARPNLGKNPFGAKSQEVHRGSGRGEILSEQGSNLPKSSQAAISITAPLRSHSIPTMTYAIIGLTMLVYLLQMNAGYVFHGLDQIEVLGARINPLIRQGQLWRFFTPALLHEGPVHLLFNMFTLLLLGLQLERYYGHGRFLLLYLLSAFAGNVLSFAAMADSSFSVGASTAIFGLMGAEGVFLYQHRKLASKQAQRAVLGIVVLLVIASGLINIVPGRDIYGHLGGLLGGLLFSWFAGPRLQISGSDASLMPVDRRQRRDILFGTGLVLLSFGMLAIWSMLSYDF